MGDTVKKNRKNPLTFLREVKGEMKKVIWPSWSQTVNNTLVVIAFILVVAIFLAIIDTLFSGVARGFIIGDFKAAFTQLFSLQ